MTEQSKRQRTYLVLGAGSAPVFAVSAAWANTALPTAGSGFSALTTPLAFGAATLLGAIGLSLRSKLHKTTQKADRISRAKHHHEEIISNLLFDADDSIILWSDGAYRWSAGQFNGLKITPNTSPAIIAQHIVSKADSALLASKMTSLIKEGKSFNAHMANLNGDPLWIAGRVHGIETVMRVIRELREEESEASLQAVIGRMSRRNSALNKLLANTPLYSWERDKEGALRWASNTYIRAVEGESREQVIARGAELLGGTDGTSPQEMARLAREAKTPYSERRFTVVDGRRCALDVSEIPHNDGTIGVALDVTPAYEAEVQLDRHLNRYQALLDQLNVGVAIFDADYRLQFYNEALMRQWDAPKEWMDAEPNLRDIFDRLHELRKVPEDTEYSTWHSETLDHYRSLMTQDQTEWHLPSGGVTRVLCQPDAKGGLLFVFEDVTDKYQLQSQVNTISAVLRAAFTRLREGVAVFDADGGLRFSNSAFSHMWGLPNNLLEQQAPHVAELFKASGTLTDHESLKNRIITHITGAGIERRAWAETITITNGMVLEVSVSPLPDGATMLSLFDMTDAHNTELDLLNQNAALERGSLVKNQFLDTIHHTSYELNTPLNTIMGFAELLATETYGPLNARQREYVESVSFAAEDLRQIIGDIIDLAKIQAAELVFSITEVNICELLSHLRRATGSADNTKLNVTCSEDIGSIPADHARLNHLCFSLVNVLLRQISPDATLSISAERWSGSVLISFLAEGVRLTEKQKDNLCAGPSPRLSSAGSEGLSLALAREFVERHGGSIEIDPTPEGDKITCHFLTSEEDVKSAVRPTLLGWQS